MADESIRLLQAQVEDSLVSIAEVYEHIENLKKQDPTSDRDIVLGYYLHVLYGLFENLFEQIAAKFENNIADKTQWHAQLLKRMTLNVKSIRPAVISRDSYVCLNELRRFRHLFRNAYLLKFDPDRLNIVLKHSDQLQSLYRTDFDNFLAFLEQLAQTET